MKVRRVDELDLAGHRVFVRADLNVPLKDGKITDPARIQAAQQTLRWVVEHGGRAIVASHLGRPKGQRVPELSLRPVAAYLQRSLGKTVTMATDCVGQQVRRLVDATVEGDILVLENLRFHSEETENDTAFAKELASLCDVYVNDAFGTAHRAHASTTGMVPFVPEHAVGFLMRTEIEHLSRLLGEPDRPFVVILGGAKVSDKIAVIRHLLTRIDSLLIGGAMAYTFLAAEGVETGSSRVEEDFVEVARDLLTQAEANGVRVILPVDHVVAEEISESARAEITGPGIPEGVMGVDVGPQTIRRFGSEIRKAKTIFWNGPVGVFEIDAFSEGTFRVAGEIARSAATSVVGGGDSARAVHESGHARSITHVSTGGGASLEFLEGRTLPALAALEAS